jgi:uncharacterized protein
MKWMGRRESTNVEDRRGVGGRTVVAGGGGIIGIIAIVLGLVFGLSGGGPGITVGQYPTQTTLAANADQLKQFVSVILASTEDVWGQQLPAQTGQQYSRPHLVLFTGSVNSACGFANAAAGPFYCPADQDVYIDLGFYDELKNRFHAPGDSAQAYVIAHEVGHHVQKLLGISDQVDAQRSYRSDTEMNQLSIRLELQADFLAGVWAHFAQTDLSIDPADIQAVITAASAIGDDTLQMETQGYVVPDSFTHGTSEQRVRWFTKGFQTGDIKQGDTFSAKQL